MADSDKVSSSSGEDKQARALRISKLYPQPTSEGRGRTFVRNESLHSRDYIDEKSDPSINGLAVVQTGAVISLPFVSFAIGLTILLGTTTQTEAGQIGMLSTPYLLFVVLIAYMTYKYAVRKFKLISSNPRLIYWMTVLCSVPITVIIIPLFTSFLPGSFYSSLIFNMVSYLLMIAVFISSTAVIISLLRRKVKIGTND